MANPPPRRGIHLEYRFAPDDAKQQGAALANPLVDLLRTLRDSGSISATARALGSSYRHTWGALKQWEATLGAPLVVWVKGQNARLTPLAERLLWAETRARSRLAPHIEALVDAADGQRWGVVDALVIEQGPNYALAKRLQQWRATVTRADGQPVVFNVAPSTSTQSVVKNPALKAGFDGAHHFGIEVFEPATTVALMAALWVHDLRHPAPAFNHPLDALTHQANHGGLWRAGYLPRSAMPLAALLGLTDRMGFSADASGARSSARAS